MNYAWRSGTTSRFDSLWALINKFAYLNAASYAQVREFFEISGRNIHPATSLYNTWAMDRSKMAAVFERTETDFDLSTPGYYALGGDLQTSNTLRWCPDCMERGFHAAAFQVRLIRMCPLHKIALEESCPVCHRPIPYEADSKTLEVPFGCPCGHVLWPGLYHRDWPCSLAHEVEAPFMNLRNWVGRFRASLSWSGQMGLMPGLVCLEPITGWKPEYFGAIAQGVVSWKYPKKKTSQKGNNDLPINMHMFEITNRRSSEIIDHIRLTTLPIFEQQLNAVITSVETAIGPHLSCAKKVDIYNATIDSIADGSCLWGAIYAHWKHALQMTGWWRLPDFNFGYHDPRIIRSYRHALAVIEGADANPFENKNPLVIWLAAHLFRAEVLHDFGRQVIAVCESHVEQLKPDDMALLDLMREVEPVYVYYPGNRKTAPTFKAYIGFSLKQLISLIKQGRGCDRHKVKKV